MVDKAHMEINFLCVLKSLFCLHFTFTSLYFHYILDFLSIYMRSDKFSLLV